VRHTLTAFCMAAGLLAATASGVAHHGAATFDTGKELVMQGTVTEWVWSNPHCFLKFDVKDQGGTVRSWVVETSNPPDMVNRGWTRRSFKPGEAVTVTVEPVKSGNPVGRLLQVAFADGRILSSRGPVAPAALGEGVPR
jgi:uncharacterized protein DUF6152